MPIKNFDVEIVIEPDSQGVDESWFDEEGEVIDWNREFFPIERLCIEDVSRICINENRQLEKIGSGELNFTDINEEEEIDLSDDGVDPWLWLDLGVRGAVMAIRAVGGYPVTSCNAGSFTDDTARHNEPHHPVIGFKGSNDCIRLVGDLARRNECGLYANSGTMILYARDIRNFGRFALNLLEVAIESGVPMVDDSSQTTLDEFGD